MLIGVFTVRLGPQLPVGGNLIRPRFGLSHPAPPPGIPATCPCHDKGYTDDRLADGAGWVTFDVRSIQCPVTVLHGGSDRMVEVIHALHTAEVVPGAKLVVFDDHGHFSIVTEVVPAISNLFQR